MALTHAHGLPANENAAPSRRYRNYVLFVLTLVYAFNFIDRQIIGILSPFIKADLGLDAQGARPEAVLGAKLDPL